MNIYIFFSAVIETIAVYYDRAIMGEGDGNSWSSVRVHLVVVVYPLSRVRLCCNPMDCKPPGSSAHGIFQTRILQWVAISFSRRSS